MKIAIAGATGQIGSQLVPLLTAVGHTVMALSRKGGVDAAIGTGLDDALSGADVLVDVLNSPTMEDDAALAFFTAATSNLTRAAKKAGVRHYVVLSIVGVGSLEGGGYLRGKVLQENTIAASGIPFTIVRATQFHELTELIVDSLVVDSEVRAPDALIQPIASAEVAAAIARVADGVPLNRVLNIAGPESMSFAELARQVMAVQGTKADVTVDPTATYFGTPIHDGSLVPGADGERASTRLSDWLSER